MESIIDCYFDNIFTQMDRGCLIPRYKRRQIVDYFSTVIRACNSGSKNYEEGCKKAVEAILKFHKKFKDNNGSVCLLGKYHNVLYVALKLCFDWRLSDHETVSTVLIDLFSCEKTFERLMIGAIFGTRVTHLISGWKSDFQTRDECLQAVEYFLDHSARSKLKFEIGGRFKTMADIPMPSYGFSAPAKVCIQAGKFDFLKVLLRYGAEPVVVINHNQCPLHLLLLRMHTLAESALPGDYKNLILIPPFHGYMLSGDVPGGSRNHELSPEETSRRDYSFHGYKMLSGDVPEESRNHGTPEETSRGDYSFHGNSLSGDVPEESRNLELSPEETSRDDSSVSKHPGSDGSYGESLPKYPGNPSGIDGESNQEPKTPDSDQDILIKENFEGFGEPLPKDLTSPCSTKSESDTAPRNSDKNQELPHKELQNLGRCGESVSKDPRMNKSYVEPMNLEINQEVFIREPESYCESGSENSKDSTVNCESDHLNEPKTFGTNSESIPEEPRNPKNNCESIPEQPDNPRNNEESLSQQPKSTKSDQESITMDPGTPRTFYESIPQLSKTTQNTESIFKSPFFPEDLIKCLQVFMSVIPQVPHTIFDNENEPTSLHPAVFTVVPRDRNGWTTASLKHLCRCEIRRCLVVNGCLPYGIYELKLPAQLQRYVDMGD